MKDIDRNGVDEQQKNHPKTEGKQPYESPKLICFGDVRDITLGGSIPGSESLGGCIDGMEPCS